MAHRNGVEIRAVLQDNETARAALASLENRGLDASAVRFDERTRERASASPESGRSDERLLDRVGSKWLLGLVAGGLLGAALGAVAGIVVFDLDSRQAVVAVLAFALGLGAAGAGLGVFAGGVWGQKQSATWEETFKAPGLEQVTLVVTASDDEEARLARSVLGEYSDDVHEASQDGG
jgi:hypothetical protein